MLFTELKKDIFAVSGLSWVPLNSIKNIISGSKEIVKKEKCEGYVINTNGTKAQCGVIFSFPKTKGIYYSLSVLLMDKLGDAWIGLFKTKRNEYLFIGVQNSLIVPGCDAIFRDHNKALERFNEYKEMFDWKVIYCSPSIGIEGTEVDLATLIGSLNLKSEAKLINLKRRRGLYKQLAATVVVGIVLLFMLHFFTLLYKERKERKRLEALQKQATIKPVEPWRNAPPAGIFLQECLKNISEYPMHLGGWRIAGALCDGNYIKTVYKRSPDTTAAQFDSAASIVYPNQYSFQKGGEAAQVNIPMKLQADRADESLQPMKELLNLFLGKLQLGEATGTIEDGFTTNKKNLKFDFNTFLSPPFLFSNSNLEGVVIKEITANLAIENTINWKITGIIYGK